MKSHPPPHGAAWLWKLAVVILLAGSGFIALIARDLPDPSAMYTIRKVIALMALLAGVCAIAATSHLWLKR